MLTKYVDYFAHSSYIYLGDHING